MHAHLPRPPACITHYKAFFHKSECCVFQTKPRFNSKEDLALSQHQLFQRPVCVCRYVNYAGTPHCSWHNVFVHTKAVLELVGRYDENIYPAYFEDTEYMVRVRKLMAKGQEIHLRCYNDVVVLHGVPTEDGDFNGEGMIASALASGSLVTRDRIRGSTHWAMDYLRRKWGCGDFGSPAGWMLHCPFETPYQKDDVGLGYWEFDAQHRENILSGLLR